MFTSSEEDESSFELETETDIASFTGFSFNRSAATSTSGDASSGTTAVDLSSTDTVLTSSSEASVKTTREAPTFVQSGAASTTASSGRADRTAGVDLGMVGGVAGVLGMLL
jgi:hypothetical protein